ncbi:potassium channel family protein [Mycoplasmopsis felis]|uniref:potassium channel family protein n=1 Tax=Mycoplasmopsis felis TaxID=33923 RepID=UPI003A4DA116
MQKIKKKYDSFHILLTSIVWSTREFDSQIKLKLRKLNLLRLVYVILVILTSLISVFSLLTPPKSIQEEWGTMVIVLQIFTFFFFLFDYVTHFITYRKYKKLDKKTRIWKSTLKYIFSFKGILILLCVLTSLHVIEYIAYIDNETLKTVNLFKILNLSRFLRLFIVLTYFAPFAIIVNAFSKQKKILTYVLLIAFLLILVFSILIWNTEGVHLEETQLQWLSDKNINQSDWKIYLTYLGLFDNEQEIFFNSNKEILEPNLSRFNEILQEYKDLSNGYVVSFIDALYFSTITLTTIGYGDYLPHSSLTKIIVSLNALIALAIIAIPSGVIAGAFLNETQEHIKNKYKHKGENKSD